MRTFLIFKEFCSLWELNSRPYRKYDVLAVDEESLPKKNNLLNTGDGIEPACLEWH
jgi:hypothetical protein